MNEGRRWGKCGAYSNYESMNQAWTRIFRTTGRRDHSICQGCGRFHSTKDEETVCKFAKNNGISHKKARRLLNSLTGRKF